MDKNTYHAFLSAFHEYPTQDNEGYIPDRGSFKSGFLAGAKFERERKDVSIREALEKLPEHSLRSKSYFCPFCKVKIDDGTYCVPCLDKSEDSPPLKDPARTS